MDFLLRYPYLLALIAGLVGAVGDAFLNQWAKNSGWHWLFAGYLGWFVTATIVAIMLKKELFSSGVMLFLLANIVFALILGRTFFLERLSFWQWVGIALGIVSMVLMECGKR